MCAFTATAARSTCKVDHASDLIAAATGSRPVSLAYPMGAVDNRTAALVAACPGMRTAVGKARGVDETWTTRFDAPRLEIRPDVTPAELLVQVKGDQ